MNRIFKSVYDHQKIVLNIPNSGLLILRDKGGPPEKVTFEIVTQGTTRFYRPVM